MEFPDERELLKKAGQGDRDAFRIIVGKHHAFAYSLAYKFTGNRQDAEDVVQEVFVRVWKNLDKYRPEIKFTTWLYTIITNRCLDFLKSVYGRNRRLHADVEQGFQVSNTSTADSALHTRELTEAVLSSAVELMPKQRAVFTLCDLEGLSMTEVSEVLNMSPSNVKSNLYYARKKIGTLVRKYYQEQKQAT